MGWNFVPDEPLESYQERFKDHFLFRREDGILEVRMHQNGGTPEWSLELHRALPQMFQAVGSDRANEVFIFTGSGDHWLHEFNTTSFGHQADSEEVFKESNYDTWFVDGTKLQENLLWSIDIPIITAINGPGFHTEFALLADLTLCSDDSVFIEPHIPLGMVPGDAQLLVFQELLGIKRANYLAYLIDGVDAQKALEWGLVNEVMPREQLLPRCWEIAREIMKSDRIVRRLTTQVLRRRWKRLFTDDFSMHFAHELFAANVSHSAHETATVERYWKKMGIKK